MSEPSPSVVAGDAAINPAPLSSEYVATILADFQTWLRDLPASPESAVPEVAAGPDLFTLLEQLTALRHEVNLQTKASRAQLEQNSTTLNQLSRTLDALQQAQAGAATAREEPLRPLLQTLVELYDALHIASREAQRVQDLLTPALHETASHPGAEPPQLPPIPAPSRLARWLGMQVPDLTAYRENLAAWRKREEEHAALRHQRAERVRQLLVSLTAGYTMGLQRIERALKQHGLQAVAAVGEAFDPERMEAVEAVADSGQATGTVLDEVQRGYLWKGRVFRYARVRVAK